MLCVNDTRPTSCLALSMPYTTQDSSGPGTYSGVMQGFGASIVGEGTEHAKSLKGNRVREITCRARL